MSHALKLGAPRLLDRHDGQAGRWFGAQYGALVERLGPFDEVTKAYAGAAAVLWVAFRRDAVALADAERARRRGKGRRPSAKEIARLTKRQALSWASYDTALRRLEELTARKPKASGSLERLLAETR